MGRGDGDGWASAVVTGRAPSRGTLGSPVPRAVWGTGAGAQLLTVLRSLAILVPPYALLWNCLQSYILLYNLKEKSNLKKTRDNTRCPMFIISTGSSLRGKTRAVESHVGGVEP